MDSENGAFAGFAASFKAEIEPQHADLVLFACCLTSRLVDSTIYNAYNTFVSMQTGNTVFVGLGASNQNARPYGCFLFARLHSVLGARKRGSLMMSFVLQASIIVISAGLIEGGVISSALGDRLSRTTPPWDQEVPIILLSIQSAGQIVASRALGFNEVPTVVITSLLCDLVSDPKLFLIRNQKRDLAIVFEVHALTYLQALLCLRSVVGELLTAWISGVSDDSGFCDIQNFLLVG
ncbi:hypothetical protein PENANT_c068G09761 [Penicillium antarcticum]|uniref:Uncharacterized protein n=1 Tax=Penicillium antarcticum TaxID=416450 RepID=A0A1V6PQK6_9EURO|nr:hypothetical protein PENANT_c068G09761 [Penicillium antarcticum]